MSAENQMHGPLDASDLRFIVDHSTDAVIVADCTGAIVYFNWAAQILYGAVAEQLRGANLWRLLPLDEAARDPWATNPPDQPLEFEGPQTRFTGPPFLCRGSLRICRAQSCPQFVCTLADVTDERRYEDILNGMFVYAGLLSADGRVIQVNQAALAGASLNPEDVIGRCLWETPYFAHSHEVQSGLRESLARVAAGEIVRQDLIVALGPDELRTFDAIFTPLRDPNGRIEQIVGSGVDVTERRAAERQLADSEGRLKQAERVAALGSWELDLLTGELVWSDELYRIFEVDPGEFHPSYEFFLSRVHPDDRERVDTAYTRSLRTGSPYEIVHRLHLPGGRVKYIEERCDTVRTEDGRPVRSFGTSQDVTRYQELQEQLHINSTALRNGGMAVVLSSLEHRIEFANPAALGLWDYSEPADVLGRPVAELFEPAEASLELAELAPQETKRNVRIARRRDGSLLPVEVVKSNVHDETGVPLCWMFSITDISERLAQQEEIRRQREELAHVVRVSIVNELTAGIAHELNQPLMAIDAYCSALESFLPVHGEPAEIVEKIAGQAKRAGDIIHRLRDMLQKSRSHRRPEQVNSIVEKVLTLVSPQAKLLRIAIHFEAGVGIPAIDADEIQVQQVLINLLQNAFDAIGDRPVRTVRIVTEAHGTGIRVQIIDSGAGVSAATVRQLFRPFYTTKSTGFGLGLGLSRSIIAAHGGELACDTSMTEGASFYFTLPGLSSERSRA
jgi:two-component system sensor kinase FixL